METVVLVLMILVCFSFVLKLTFQSSAVKFAVCGFCIVFVGLSITFAIEQSKIQIQQWLLDPELMSDTSVILFIDVLIQTSYAILGAQLMTSGIMRKSVINTYRILRIFPGLLLFPVLFYLLVQVIFAFPGSSFNLLGWLTAVISSLFILGLSFLIKYLLPEKDIRLELLFLVNLLIAMIGVIATVNGRTAVAGVSDINWDAVGGVIGLALSGIGIGLLLRKYSIYRKIKK